MSLPFTFPDWMPWWLQLLVVVVAVLLGLAFACMPFSVFGVKTRLDALEERLDEIQGEIRRLALRLPEPGLGYEEDTTILRAAAPLRDTRPKPPIPPASWDTEARPRAEPRLGKPR